MLRTMLATAGTRYLWKQEQVDKPVAYVRCEPGRELTAKQKPDRYASDCAKDEALADAPASA